MSTFVTSGQLQSFDEEKRELYVRVLPWDTEVSTERGVESFKRGAFEGIDPGRFILRQRHQDPPTGRGIELEETDEALMMRLKVARTAAGDDQLTLAREGIETGVSVGFEDGKYDKKQLGDGRFSYTHQRVKEDGVLEISTTYRPAYGEESRVLQVLERSDVAEDKTVETEAPAATPANMVTDEQLQEFQSNILGKVEALRDKQTAMSTMVAPQDDQPAHLKRNVDIQLRELAEVITTGNLGVVPDVLSNEIIGRITQGRPFLNATRQVPAPSVGLSLLFPKITQLPLVATQAAEKDEVASQATAIGTVDFNMVTKAGAGDLSLQLIRRSSPQFLSLWVELLADAYAKNSEDGAIDALLAATVTAGGVFDPGAPPFGTAFSTANTASAGTMKADRIFMSTAGLVAMMNETVPAGGGGTPFYPGLSGINGLTADGGTNELGLSLQPVWCPELDDETPDIIIGPSRGFVWAEDATYTLAADVPSKAGRDVGIVGFIWYAPIYPLAFTSYTLS